MTERSDNTDLPSAADLAASTPGLRYDPSSGPQRPRKARSGPDQSRPDLDPFAVPTGEVDSELAKLPGAEETEPPKPPAPASRPWSSPGRSNPAPEPDPAEPLWPAAAASVPEPSTPATPPPASEPVGPATVPDEPVPAAAVEVPDESSALEPSQEQEEASAFAPSPSTVVGPAAGYLTPPPQPPRPETSGDLAEDRVLRSAEREPVLHRVLRKATFGLVSLGESPEQVTERRYAGLAQTAIPEHHRLVVMGLKGGSGKTSTVTGLGQTLATLRGDHVVAMDANPDRGTLGTRIGTEHPKTVRHLLEYEREHGITSLPHLRQFLSQALPSRLFVLASERDAAASQAFSAEDYRTTARVLERFLPLGITDCGTGLLFDALSGEGGVLDLADQVVVVCGPSVDEAQSASATLDYLESHRWGNLAENAVVVMTKVPDAKTLKRSAVDLNEIEAHFKTRVRHTLRIPYDPHIAEGGQMELDKLAPTTRRAFLELAAMVGSRFNEPLRVPEPQ